MARMSIGFYFAFLAVFAALSLERPYPGAIVEIWGSFVEMAGMNQGTLGCQKKLRR